MSPVHNSKQSCICYSREINGVRINELTGVRNQIGSRSLGRGHVADATTSEEHHKTGGSGTRQAPAGMRTTGFQSRSANAVPFPCPFFDPLLLPASRPPLSTRHARKARKNRTRKT